MTPRRAGLSEHAGRSGRRWRALVAQLRAAGGPCAICGQPIDYTLKFPDPWSFQADHKVPLDVRPDLAEDPANLQPSHFRCNNAKRNNPNPLGLGLLSEDW